MSDVMRLPRMSASGKHDGALNDRYGAQSGNDFRSGDERELSAAATLNWKTEIAVLAAEG